MLPNVIRDNKNRKGFLLPTLIVRRVINGEQIKCHQVDILGESQLVYDPGNVNKGPAVYVRTSAPLRVTIKRAGKPDEIRNMP